MLNAVLPPPTIKFEDADDAKTYKPLQLPSDAEFKKGQFIAKACQLKDGLYEFFVGRVNALTKAGPYLHFDTSRRISSSIS